ncbi:MAG: radical SAM protein [Candidatus Alcyoniella australis]|nr:radical SAM protein [Candidatus Alcyoniella australis]
MIEVCELFAGLAGEGVWSGRAAAFVRLSGCNLRCCWCDTSYAWEGGERMRRASVVVAIRRMALKRVVVTGGEPLLQRETPRLLADLLDRGLHTALETNGTFALDQVPQGVHIAMDLKPPSSGHADSVRWSNLERLGPNDELKVVIADRADLDWLVRVLHERADQLNAPVYVQPAHGRLAARRLADWLVEQRLDLRLGIQLHKLLWGTERGR